MTKIFFVIDPLGDIVSITYDYKEAKRIKKKESSEERPLSILKIIYKILEVID